MLDTIPVRTDEHFPIAPVAEYLRAQGMAVADLEVEQFPAGHSNLTYLLRSGSWEAVLRRPPLGPVPPRAHDMPREFRILQHLFPSFPLAPEPYVLCEDPGVIGAPFYVMERRRGLILDQDLPADWRPTADLHHAIAGSLVRVLVDLHNVDWQAAGLGDIGHPEGYMQRQVSGWIERYLRARTTDVPGVDELSKWIADQRPESPAPTMIHNDYKLNNVLLDVDEPRNITAVLDWEMATIGDPLSDVASLLVYWTEPVDSDAMGALRSVTSEPGFPSRDELLAMYVRASGRDVSLLNWYLAFAYFKVGVICQQIYYRWFKGQTHDQRFSDHGELATYLIKRASIVAGLS